MAKYKKEPKGFGFRGSHQGFDKSAYGAKKPVEETQTLVPKKVKPGTPKSGTPKRATPKRVTPKRVTPKRTAKRRGQKGSGWTRGAKDPITGAVGWIRDIPFKKPAAKKPAAKKPAAKKPRPKPKPKRVALRTRALRAMLSQPPGRVPTAPQRRKATIRRIGPRRF